MTRYRFLDISMTQLCLRTFDYVVDRIENTTSDAELARRFDTRSKLTIRAQPDDNDADYICEARHPALIAPKRASVALNIQCKTFLFILALLSGTQYLHEY